MKCQKGKIEKEKEKKKKKVREKEKRGKEGKEISQKKNKAGYTAQDAPSMRTFHLRK